MFAYDVKPYIEEEEGSESSINFERKRVISRRVKGIDWPYFCKMFSCPDFSLILAKSLQNLDNFYKLQSVKGSAV